MQLGRLLEQISYESVQGSQELDITDICYHSGKVKQGSLFVCMTGQRADGHDYIREAATNGAAAFVVETSSVVNTSEGSLVFSKNEEIRLNELIKEFGVAVVFVQDGRKALAYLSAAFFDYPAKKLKMIGITGTKGKTTTAFLTAGILSQAGYRTGMVGTIWIDTGKEKIPADHTTPESYDLQRYLAEMVKNGCDCCVMEVSSQGIKCFRTQGIYFDIGVFLNIEPDHIGAGEHASFSEYLYCKSRLMRQCAIGIVNQDDPNVNRILCGHTCDVETFSMKQENEAIHFADMIAEDAEFWMKRGRLGSSFRIRCGGKIYRLQMQLPGIFNIYNALAAVSVSMHFKVEERHIRYALRKQTIPGRCENLGISEDYAFLIDYAHNEMSLRNLLLTLRALNPGRLIVIFGCGGNRSGLRRSRMGETAGRLADFTILTSDNPRWEEPETILDDIESGIRETTGRYIRIADRGKAVAYAIANAGSGDIIVLAGKGHEGYQEIRGVRYPLSEYDLVKDAVKQQKVHIHEIK